MNHYTFWRKHTGSCAQVTDNTVLICVGNKQRQNASRAEMNVRAFDKMLPTKSVDEQQLCAQVAPEQ